MASTMVARTLGPGDELGGHRILRQLGEGGMGVVYLAEHKLMGRHAAIKVLLPAYSGEPELTSRFFNEARAATKIRHQGIVEIYDFGHQPDGTAYIIMEFLEGESLDGRIKRLGTVPLGNTLHVARQIASALAAAHAKGIVHRDLKPDNVFLVPDRDMDGGERIKVLDFGIAKLSEAENATGSVKTRTGVVMGTPAYMAPEQCKGAGDVDHRADLYSLGCMIYEMLSGRPPFEAEGAGELIAKHIYEQPLSLRALNPIVPEAVDTFVRRLLAKAPGQRYASAEQTIGELDRLIAGTGAAQTVAWGSGSTPPLGGLMGMPTPPPMSIATSTSPSASGYRGEVAAHSTGIGVPAAGTVALTAPPRSSSRRLVWLAAAAVGISLFIGGAVLLLRARPSPTKKPVAASKRTAPITPVPGGAKHELADAGAVVAPTPVRREPLPQPPPPVAEISIQVESTPTGASVYLEPRGLRVGRTPYTHTMKPQAGELVLTLSKSGYLNRRLVVSANASANELVVLQPAAPRKPPKRRVSPRASRPAPATRKPPSKNRLNPFDPK